MRMAGTKMQNQAEKALHRSHPSERSEHLTLLQPQSRPEKTGVPR